MNSTSSSTTRCVTSRHATASLLAALWLGQALLLILDLLSGGDIALRAYYSLPALFAAAFAPPLQVLLLALASLLAGLTSGWHFDILFTWPYLVRFGGLVLIGLVAVFLARLRERHLAATHREHARLQATLDSLLDPHVVFRALRDARGRITDFLFVDANEAACRYNRRPRAELVGHRLLEILPAHTATGLLDHYRDVIRTGKPLALDDFVYPHDILQEPRYYDIRAVGSGDEISYTWRDVTARHRASAELARQARTDELTQLLNRREGLAKLDEYNHRTPRTGHRLAVLFIDFDRFKAINDAHGHAAGDEILRTTADRIRSCLRHADDLAARLGGDEMMVVLHGVHNLADAAAVAEKLRTLAAQPVCFNGSRLHATVSIGVTLVRPGESTWDIISRADAAMYEAKQHGRNRVVKIGDAAPALPAGNYWGLNPREIHPTPALELSSP